MPNGGGRVYNKKCAVSSGKLRDFAYVVNCSQNIAGKRYPYQGGFLVDKFSGFTQTEPHVIVYGYVFELPAVSFG